MLKISPTFSSFSITNLEEAKTFYGDTLELEVKHTPEGLEINAVGCKAFAYQKPNHSPATFTILNFLVEDIDVVVDELNKKGVTLKNYPELHTDEKGICRNDGSHPGPKAIGWFTDPSGNILSIIQEK